MSTWVQLSFFDMPAFNPAPKPTKSEREAEKAQQRRELLDYRHVQVSLAISRDDSRCVFCWFLNGKLTPRDEVHHVYGRGDQAGDWREHYTNLLGTCKKHHPKPIMTPGTTGPLAYVEDVRRLANEKPINLRFVPPGSSA